MSSAGLPPPVVFDLDASESARIQNEDFAGSGGLAMLSGFAGVAVLQSVSIVGRLLRYHGKDPVDWALLGADACLLAAIIFCLATRRRWHTLFVRAHRAVTIRFKDTGLEVSSGSERGANERNIPFERIRTVRLLPEALFIQEARKPIVLIPTRALPDDGAQLMLYFDEHLVAKGMLRRSAFGRTTIVNTLCSGT